MLLNSLRRRPPLLAGPDTTLPLQRYFAADARWLGIHHNDEPDLILSDGYGHGDVHAIRAALRHLRTQGGGALWQLSSDRKGLQREFTFKTFKTTWVSDKERKREIYISYIYIQQASSSLNTHMPGQILSKKLSIHCY